MNQGRLVLICAPSGAGKTLFSKDFANGDPANIVRLSSDELRAIIGKDENDQSVSFIVFRTMENMAEYFMLQGKTVVIDATNYNLKSRKNFIDIAKKVNASTVAYILDRPLEQLKLWNTQRARQVPDDVIERQFSNFVHPVKGEVDEVYYV